MDSLLENMRVYRPGARREDFLFLNARAGNLLRSGIVRDVLGKSAKRARSRKVSHRPAPTCALCSLDVRRPRLVRTGARSGDYPAAPREAATPI